MFTISREFEFSYAHRLWRYDGKCSNLHGHNGKVRITLEQNSVDDLGLSVDFHRIKETIEQWVESNWDHKTILSSDDPLLPILKSADVDCVEFPSNPTSEQFAKLLFEQSERFGLPVVSVEFWETPKCVAKYEQEERGKRKNNGESDSVSFWKRKYL